MKFGPLPGTAGEIESLRRLMTLPPEALFAGPRTTKAAVTKAAGPRLLHLATHGFFLADGTGAPGADRGWVNPESQDDGRRVALSRLNGLLRSGLALAGANRHAGQSDDGILTALEASGLDLWGTQLPVLSACETGLGEVRNRDGIYGMRRAFVLAGSRAQVISLWKVDDAATSDLMVAFYGRLPKGQGCAAALREVQRRMLAGSERKHPSYWAAFIPSGDGGPLGE